MQAQGGNCGPNVISECNSAWEGYKGKSCEFVCGLCDKCKGIFRTLVPDCKYCPKGRGQKACISTCNRGTAICRKCGLLWNAYDQRAYLYSCLVNIFFDLLLWNRDKEYHVLLFLMPLFQVCFYIQQTKLIIDIAKCNSACDWIKGKTCEIVCSLCNKFKGISKTLVPQWTKFIKHPKNAQIVLHVMSIYLVSESIKKSRRYYLLVLTPLLQVKCSSSIMS